MRHHNPFSQRHIQSKQTTVSRTPPLIRRDFVGRAGLDQRPRLILWRTDVNRGTGGFDRRVQRILGHAVGNDLNRPDHRIGVASVPRRDRGEGDHGVNRVKCIHGIHIDLSNTRARGNEVHTTRRCLRQAQSLRLWVRNQSLCEPCCCLVLVNIVCLEPRDDHLVHAQRRQLRNVTLG